MGKSFWLILAKIMLNQHHFALTKRVNKSILRGQCLASLGPRLLRGETRHIMTMNIKKLLVLFGVRAFEALRKAASVARVLLPIVLVPLRIVWSFVLRPITIILYKLYIILGERLKTFFYAQHKILSVITHRFAIHVFVVLLTFAIVTTNVLRANEVRAEQFTQGSLIAKIFQPDEETTVTASSATPVRTTYIDSTHSVKLIPHISSTLQNDSDSVMVASNGSALVRANTLGGATGSSASTIQQYTVEGGDTISSIAAQFGVSTQTVLWSNNMTDSSVIKPGMTLYILPTSGVAHTVASGETVSSIAQKYGASSDEIVAYNHLIDASDLIAGVEIIIPGGKQPEPVQVKPQQTQLASLSRAFTTSSNAPANAVVTGGSLQWPTTTHRISQYFTGFHTGLDIDGEFGDPIYAADGGVAVQVGWNGAYGLSAVIVHPNGLKTRYGHMQKVFISQGQSVSRGQTIGEEGSTGRSSGSHLHFETIVGSSFVNPFNYY